MPLQLPNLDDRTYTDLVQEGLSLIPPHAPDWTNHNPSDPGITLIELFAYATEMLLYRLNRVTDANQEAFLRLLNGTDWQRSPNKSLDDEIRDTVLQLRQIKRAVTREDFEFLAKAVNPGLAEARKTGQPAPVQNVSRVRCIPRRNLEQPRPAALQEDQPGHISLVILPDRPPPNSPLNNPLLIPMSDLRQAIQDYLEPQRLLTDRIHIVPPQYLTIKVQLTVFLQTGAQEITLRDQIPKALTHFFDPQTWPFGRNIYVSEIYELIDKIPGVDYVTPTTPNGQPDQDEILITPTDNNPSRKIRADDRPNSKLSAIQLNIDELVNCQADPALITIQPAQ